MSWALLWETWRHRARSPVCLGVLAVTFVYPLVEAVGSRAVDLPSAVKGFLVPLILGSGIIGEDVASGSLLLTLARPLRRWELVLSKWTAVAIASLAVLLAQTGTLVLIGAALDTPDSPTLADVATHATGCLGAAAGGAATMVLFGSLFRGWQGSGAWLCAFILPLLTVELADLGEPGREVVRAVVRPLILPHLDLDAAFGYSRISWSEVTSLLMGISACLTIAVFALNRREMPDNR